MAKNTVAQQALNELNEMEARSFPGEHTADSAQAPDTAARPEKGVKEKLFIPLDPNGNSDTVFLCVNGKNMLVKRGEQVELPAEFAEAYRNAQAQQLAAVQAQRAAASKE